MRKILALVAMLSLAGAAAAQSTGKPSSAAGSSVPASAGAYTGSDGNAVFDSETTPHPVQCVVKTSSGFVPCAAMAAANSTPLEGAVTSSTVTPTSGSGTISGGIARIGPLAPVLGREIRVILKGTWSGSFAIGTASAVNGCTAGNINPLTLAGQTWGSFTGNANEVVDTPTLGATPAGTAPPVYCATATVTSGTLTYAVRQ